MIEVMSALPADHIKGPEVDNEGAAAIGGDVPTRIVQGAAMVEGEEPGSKGTGDPSSSEQSQQRMWDPGPAGECLRRANLWDPATNHMHPLSTVDWSSATQHDADLLSGIAGQYPSSWCHGVSVLVCGSL
eukprot:CAMPEP_0174265324 /NCGR_PEP_ID=MMETSP0439-20130205/26081_1 /TAXON_ID=0 /ORGANISM="Stereomyxa ramosa, Strain Chinc5" /LENGTH=129 /DNA_ID=CAMNT_0015351731 /DNA_START=104 /DNA_END=494 /DNA_ORIENTATION=+